MKKLFNKVLLFTCYEKYILYAYKRLIDEDYADKTNESRAKFDKGLEISPSCCFCFHDVADNEAVIIFGCQHLFHNDPKCLESKICPICSKSEAYTGIFKISY